MALFDVKAALAEILNGKEGCCDSCDSCDSDRRHIAESRKSQESQPPSAEIAMPANVLPLAPSRQDPKNRDKESAQEMRRTWTGRIVNMDDWRSLSEWERYGPGERMYCGICRAWVSSFPDCHEVRT